jgi:hypothetical protein
MESCKDIIGSRNCTQGLDKVIGGHKQCNVIGVELSSHERHKSFYGPEKTQTSADLLEEGRSFTWQTQVLEF